MSNSDVTVDSLYNLSLNKLCSSMDQDTLQYICKWYPSSIVINIIWKLLHINNGNEEFVHNFTLHMDFKFSADRGMNLYGSTERFILDYWKDFDFRKASDITNKPNVEIPYDDQYNVCEQFNLDLFFKLVKIPHSRNKLYIIFQICVRKMGNHFPKLLAKQWIDMKKEEVDHTIQNGLELGIFLGDTGWLYESALVLTYTYEKICSKLTFYDTNLKLNQTVQCLTKLLLVTVNVYNFDEAKVILRRIMNTIDIIEKRNSTTISLAYAYYAVSQYFFVFMDYNKAWLWIKKSANVLNEESDTLKLLVISHTIKVCGVTNKISTGLKLMNQLYKYEYEIEQTVIADIKTNQLYYFLRTEILDKVDENSFIVMDIMRNLFGYINLNTAITFMNLVQAYVHFEREGKYRAIDSVCQAMIILKKLRLPEDNLLRLYAEHIGSIVRPKIIYTHDLTIFNELIKINSNIIEKSIKTFGYNLFTAKISCNIAKILVQPRSFSESETLYECGIKIKKIILGDESPEVAHSLSQLADLYYYMEKYQEAEQFCLRSISIFQNLYGPNYKKLRDIYRILLSIYFRISDEEKIRRYSILFRDMILNNVAEISNSVIFDTIHKNSEKHGFSLEEVKCVLNEDLN